MTFSTAALAMEEGVDKREVGVDMNRKLIQIAAQVLNVVAYFANVLLSNQNGRLDTAPSSTVMYLAPATYAFLIWPVIFLTELIFLVWQLVQWPGWAPKSRSDAILAATPGWCAGHLFQLIWSFVFVERFNTPGLLWLSAVMLAGIAVSLNFAHLASSTTWGWQETILMSFPISLHFGWTTAASLVNWNGWVAMITTSIAVKLVVLALSLTAAATAGIFIGVRRSSPAYGGTIAWACIAVGVGSLTMDPFKKELGNTLASVLGATEILVGVAVFAVCAISGYPKMVRRPTA